MKKFLLSLVIVAFIISGAFGASSISDTWNKGNVGDGISEMVITWTAHTDGTVTAEPVSVFNGFILQCIVDPGVTAPTAAYDITFVSNGVDMMAGALMNRSATATELVFPTNSPFIHGGFDFTITNNAVNSATGTVTCIILDSR